MTHEISSRPNVILTHFFSLIAIISLQSLSPQCISHTMFPGLLNLPYLCSDSVFPLSQTVLKQHRSQVRQKSSAAVSIHEKTGCYVSRTNCLSLYLPIQSLWAPLTLLHTHAVMKCSAKSINSRNGEKSSCHAGDFLS